jgi:hypothetical protein
MEHFVTLFDSSFLLQGLALYDSLSMHGEPFVLWVVCIDQHVERSHIQHSLPHLETIPIGEVEECHPQLLTVKQVRSQAEYCWTLTPFAPEAVLRREPGADRGTYLDADVYFFGPPSRLLALARRFC